jgi:hypothetical protein
VQTSNWGEFYKKCFNLHWELSNYKWHATYTQANQGDSQFLMVRSQIGTLTLNSSFGHNLCFKYSNGMCEPILDIYIPKTFQWYKELFNPMNLTPVIVFWRFESPLGLQLPKWEPTWECVSSFFHTFPHSQEHKMWLLGLIIGPHLCKPLS